MLRLNAYRLTPLCQASRAFSTVTEAEVASFARETFDVNYDTEILSNINENGVFSIRARYPS